MDSYIESTDPVIFPQWCPDCPEPTSERFHLTDHWDIHYCSLHRPKESGTKDSVANPLGETWYPTINSEMSDPALCDFLHRRIIR